MTQDQPWKVALKIGFWSQKCRYLAMRAVHQRRVPKEAKHEEEDEGCNECEEEFFPIHKMSLLRFLLSPDAPGTFIAKWVADVDPKFLSVNPSRKK